MIESEGERQERRRRAGGEDAWDGAERREGEQESERERLRDRAMTDGQLVVADGEEVAVLIGVVGWKATNTAR